MTSSPSQHDSYVERIHGGGFQYTERSKTRRHYNICGVSVGVISSVFVEFGPLRLSLQIVFEWVINIV